MWGNGSPSICFSSCFHWVIGVDVTKGFAQAFLASKVLGCSLRRLHQGRLWRTLSLPTYYHRLYSKNKSRLPQVLQMACAMSKEHKVKPDFPHSHICVGDVPSDMPSFAFKRKAHNIWKIFSLHTIQTFYMTSGAQPLNSFLSFPPSIKSSCFHLMTKTTLCQVIDI